MDGDVKLQPTISKLNKIKSERFETLNGTRGLPGLEFRINSKGFLYAGLLAGPIIDDEIRRIRLISSKQCFQQLNGCIEISNLVISKYRCPQLVSLYPAPPNRLIFNIQNLDLECYVSLGFNDVFLQHGDLLGDIFNSYFRGKVAEQIRKQLPIGVCKMIRHMVEKRINIPLRTTSNVIQLEKLLGFAINSIKRIDLPKHQHSTSAETLQRVTLSPVSSTSFMNVRGMDVSTSREPCADCISKNESILFYALDNLDKHIDKILPDVVLNMHLMKVFATPDYFQLGLRAAFTRSEMNDTLFFPFPMHFPNGNNRMLDILISDYTINSLLYHMHKNDVIMFRVGPEVPKFGSLLKTTCSDEDYDDFVDLDAEEKEVFDDDNNSTKISAKFKKRRKRSTPDNDTDSEEDKGEEDVFGDLGVCIGDIMPAIREKYPKKLINIKVYSKRAPFVTLLADNNGTAKIDLELEAELYIDDSGEKVGTMLISSTIDGNIQISTNRVIALIKIQSLQLIDKDETLGLPPDALENLANLAKDIVSQIANNEISEGLTIQLTDNLPYKLVNQHFSIVDHAFHISTDVSVSVSVFGITSSTICRRF